jgi:hypothetical protein
MMTMRRSSGNARGFSLIEFAVMAAIVGLLATKLLRTETMYQEQAEKVAVEQMLGTLRSALHLEVASLMAKGNMGGIGNLAGQNPMDWLGEKPKNYVGVYYSPKAGMIDAGNWYFDMGSKNLVYLASNASHLQTAAGEGKILRFRAKLVVDSGSGTGTPVARGVVLEPVSAYRWF